MLDLDEALTRILAALPRPQSECIPLSEACGRILRERILAPLDLPVFDNSSVDGYAVRATDVAGAGPQSPVRLSLSGRVATGETFANELAAGTCVRLFTGSPLPRGADAVVMQEDTRTKPEHLDEVQVLDPVRHLENVRLRGEDVSKGATLIEAGERLTAGRMSLLAAVGLAQVSTGRRPLVGLLVTGSELTEPGMPLKPGGLYESNRTGLAPLVRQAGGIPNSFPIVPDTPHATAEALERAFKECDIVVTCGGVSVGEADFVKPVLEQLGGRLEFWKVAIKPGKPFVFGSRSGKFLFGLPGNPVSAFVTFLLFVRPALLRWQGARQMSLPTAPGRLAEPLANPGSRRHFMRVTLDERGQVRSSGLQASHVLNSFATANGLVDVAPQTTLPAGIVVPVLRWD